jgi:hypothetical protein
MLPEEKCRHYIMHVLYVRKRDTASALMYLKDRIANTVIDLLTCLSLNLDKQKLL